MSKEVPVSKSDFVASIIAEINADSIGDQEELRMTMNLLQAQLEQRQQAREEEEAYNSEEAVANRKAAEELFAGMKDNPPYHPGEKGVYYQVITKGNGTKLTDGQEVMIEYSIDTLDGNRIFRQRRTPAQSDRGRSTRGHAQHSYGQHGDGPDSQVLHTLGSSVRQERSSPSWV